MYSPIILIVLFIAACTPKGRDSAPANDSQSGFTHLSTVTGDIPAPSASTQQTASLLIDANGDGRQDFVIGCRQGAPALVLYLRGHSGWTRSVIDPGELDIEAGGACFDIDRDGDLDIVMGGDYRSNQVWWWENPGPDLDLERAWTRRLIKDSGKPKHHDQMFGDFDWDGAPELVFWNQDAHTLFMAEIPADPRSSGPWELDSIFGWSENRIKVVRGDSVLEVSNEHEGLAAADINGDGLPDIMGGGGWFERMPDGRFKAHVIDSTKAFTRCAAGQLVEGGPPEVVLAPGDAVGQMNMYHLREDGAWEKHRLLERDIDHGHSLAVADLDGDGYMDIFCAEMRLDGGNPAARALAFLGDGTGGFMLRVLLEGYGNHESRAADLDGDGDIDILGKPYNWETPRLDLWLNAGGAFRGAQ